MKQVSRINKLPNPDSQATTLEQEPPTSNREEPFVGSQAQDQKDDPKPKPDTCDDILNDDNLVDVLNMYKFLSHVPVPMQLLIGE
jgi:hypothetical protein